MPPASTASSFLFVAARPGGKRKVGLRQAGSQRALADGLRRDSLMLLRAYRVPGLAVGRGAMSLKDQIALNEALGQLLTRGVPLVEALDVTAQAVRAATRPRVERLRELVAGGAAFADACRRVGGFDQITIAVYAGAERTGDLGGAAKELATAGRRRMAVGSKAITLMMYPAFVLTLSLVLALGMMVVLVPRIGASLTQIAGTGMPGYSRFVFGLGTWMSEHLLWVLVGIVAVLTLGLFLRKTIARAAEVAVRRTPVLSAVLLAQESARFFSVMAAMTRTGVPLADALATANTAITHRDLRRQLERMRMRLIAGGVLRTLIDEVTTLPVGTRKLLVAAERSGDLEAAFTTLADDLTDEVDRKSARALALLEPLVIVFMATVIGSVIMAILLPVITMAAQVK